VNVPDRWLIALTFATTIGAGLIAGVFFAFSTFVMKALSRLPAPDAVAAMQSINIVVINPIFLGVFLTTTAACAVLALFALLRWPKPATGFLLTGALLYLIGTFAVTIFCNVPLNNTLGKLTPSAADAASYWSHYLSRWTMWNHIRTLAAALALASFILALRTLR
jgi:uncharacterized membrane protein